MDADYVVVGSYSTQGKRLEVRAQVLRVNQLRLSPPLADSSDLQKLYDAENAIAWKIAREIDPNFSVAEGTFLAASAGVPLSSFENYVRGVNATSQTERAAPPGVQPCRRRRATPRRCSRWAEHSSLQETTTMRQRRSPSFRRTIAARLRRGSISDSRGMNTAKYPEAEQAFAFVASRLPLPEVINNQAVAVSRQGRDAAALFQRAVTADPNDADYHFNLAVCSAAP